MNRASAAPAQGDAARVQCNERAFVPETSCLFASFDIYVIGRV